MKKIIKYLIVFVPFLALIIKPETGSAAVQSALSITVKRIIPSIFPFMVLSEVMAHLLISAKYQSKSYMPSTKSEVIFLTTPSVLLGNLSGFPIGAKNTSKLCQSGILTPKQGLAVALLSANAGFSFVIAYVGFGLFQSKGIGILLYLCQLIASLLTAFTASIFNVKNKINIIADFKNEQLCKRNFEDIISKAVSDASLSSLSVAAFITYFRVIIEYINVLFEHFGGNILIRAAVSSVLEISNGCIECSFLPFPNSLILCSFALGFTGISVMLQSTVHLKKAGIDSRQFVFFKFLQGCISALLTYLTAKFLPWTACVSTETHLYCKAEKYLSVAVLLLISVSLSIFFKNAVKKSVKTKEKS